MNSWHRVLEITTQLLWKSVLWMGENLAWSEYVVISTLLSETWAYVLREHHSIIHSSVWKRKKKGEGEMSDTINREKQYAVCNSRCLIITSRDLNVEECVTVVSKNVLESRFEVGLRGRNFVWDGEVRNLKLDDYVKFSSQKFLMCIRTVKS